MDGAGCGWTGRAVGGRGGLWVDGAGCGWTGRAVGGLGGLLVDGVGCGALDGGGGVPMSPADFKKWQRRISLSLIYAHVTCQI